MRSGRIEIVHNFTGEPGYIILVWYRTAAPLAEIGREVYPAPHGQESLLIENLRPEMHFVKAFRSSDGVSLDEQINVLAADAGARATYQQETFEYIVDRGESGEDPDWADPASGQIELRDERLLNQNYQVSMRGTGIRSKLDEIVDRSDDGGGFDLVLPEVFNPEDRIYVTVFYPVDVLSDTGGSGELDEDIILITTDDDLDASMYGATLIVDSSLEIVQLNIPNLALIPDTEFSLTTHHGTQRYCILQFDVGDSIKFLGSAVNRITLGRGEEIRIAFKEGVPYVKHYEGDARRVGRREWGDKQELNSIFRDGSEYQQSDYPRLMDWIDTLPPTQVVSYLAWEEQEMINGVLTFISKGLFARDDGAGTFRVPDDRDMFIRSLKTLDGADDTERYVDKPGGYQHDSVGPFTLSGTFPKGHAYTGPPNNEIFGNGGNASLQQKVIGGIPVTTGASSTRGRNIGLLPILII